MGQQPSNYTLTLVTTQYMWQSWRRNWRIFCCIFQSYYHIQSTLLLHQASVRVGPIQAAQLPQCLIGQPSEYDRVNYEVKWPFMYVGIRPIMHCTQPHTVWLLCNQQPPSSVAMAIKKWSQKVEFAHWLVKFSLSAANQCSVEQKS